MVNKLLCIKCQKEIAEYKELKGITTWFGVCSECLFSVKGWTRKDIEKEQKTNQPQKLNTTERRKKKKC